MFPKIIQELIEIFSRFPGVGKRTAQRFVFYLAKMKTEEFEFFIKKCNELKKIKFCNFCFNLFENENSLLCPICQDFKRNKKIILIVEKEINLETIEQTKKYNGLYFVLGKSYSPLNDEKEEEIKMRIPFLIERIKNPENFGIKTVFQEIIIATNTTLEGENTALFLQKKLKPLKIKITRLGKGLSTAGEIEYSDDQTIFF
ncbi:MAG: toprim domain-containing protein, partial [Minisyncoccales bacterium]